jgi:hypothetical protein
MVTARRYPTAVPIMISQKNETPKGTLTLDATCALAYIRYPQDISLLNEAREKL